MCQDSLHVNHYNKSDQTRTMIGGVGMKLKLIGLSFATLILAANAFGQNIGPIQPQDHAMLELPGLTGNYHFGDIQTNTGPSERSTILIIPDEIKSFEQLRFIVSGLWKGGKQVITRDLNGFTVTDTLGYNVDLTLRLTSPSIGDCYLEAIAKSTNGPLNCDELVVQHCPIGPGKMQQLLGSKVTAELVCSTTFASDSYIIEDSFGTLLDVTVEVVGAVPTTKSTLDSVKAKYH